MKTSKQNMVSSRFEGDEILLPEGNYHSSKGSSGTLHSIITLFSVAERLIPSDLEQFTLRRTHLTLKNTIFLLSEISLSNSNCTQICFALLSCTWFLVFIYISYNTNRDA